MICLLNVWRNFVVPNGIEVLSLSDTVQLLIVVSCKSTLQSLWPTEVVPMFFGSLLPMIINHILVIILKSNSFLPLIMILSSFFRQSLIYGLFDLLLLKSMTRA